MNLKLITILLCTSIVFSQTSTTAKESAQAFADFIKVCRYSDINRLAVREKADSLKLIANTEANDIRAAAIRLALQNQTIANINAEYAKDNPTAIYVIADYQLALNYASADLTAANARSYFDQTAANAIADHVRTVYVNDADAQKIIAHSLFTPVVTGDYSHCPATVKAYNDCLRVNFSVTAATINKWAVARITSNTIRRIAVAQNYVVLNIALHAADELMFATRVPGYSGIFNVGSLTNAYANANADYNNANANANAIWTASNADADAQVVYINAEYVSSNQNISFDQLLVVDSRVTADQSAADAAVLAFSA